MRRLRCYLDLRKINTHRFIHGALTACDLFKGYNVRATLFYSFFFELKALDPFESVVQVSTFCVSRRRRKMYCGH